MGLLLLVAGVLVLAGFRSLVHSLILAELPLSPGSRVTSAWVDPPVRPLLRLYFFNTTNPAGFLRGEKPKLAEMGPYVYEEEWHKVNENLYYANPSDCVKVGVSWSEVGDRVRYRLKKIYRFRPDLSGGRTEMDHVTIPNVPLLASVNQLVSTTASHKNIF